MACSLISVILPVYNAAPYVEECIRSLMNQTYKCLEIIVIDDGSSDSSFEIISRLAAEDNRIRLISRPNKGLISTLNEGLATSLGEFVVRMDADDVSDLKRIEVQYEYMMKNPECDVVGSSAILINALGVAIGKKDVPIAKEDIHAHMLINSPLLHPSVMIRRSALNDERYSDEDYLVEDYGLWLRLNKWGNIRNISKPLIYYRIHDESVSIKNKERQYLNAAQVRYRYLLPKISDGFNDNNGCSTCFLDLNVGILRSIISCFVFSFLNYRKISNGYVFRLMHAAVKLRFKLGWRI